MRPPLGGSSTNDDRCCEASTHWTGLIGSEPYQRHTPIRAGYLALGDPSVGLYEDINLESQDSTSGCVVEVMETPIGPPSPGFFSSMSSVSRPNKAVRYSIVAVAVLLFLIQANRWAADTAYVPFSAPKTGSVFPYSTNTGQDVHDPNVDNVKHLDVELPEAKVKEFTVTVTHTTTATTTSAVASTPTINHLTMIDESDDRVFSRIGKVTGVYYENVSDKSQAYEAALLSHVEHDHRFGYRHYVLRREVIKGLWSKEGYVLNVLIQELQKPPAERLDWLFWHDADVVLVNSQIPLEIFIPPQSEWGHINFVSSNDLNGLNDGTFMLRVCEWSLRFMAAGLSFTAYNPEVNLRYDEQSALTILTQQSLWQNHTMHVPQRWFNAYHHYGTNTDIPPEWHWSNGYIEPGDMLVHLPGSGESRGALIKEWLGKIQAKRETYNIPLKDTMYEQNITKFWKDDAKNEVATQEDFWRRFHVIQEVGSKQDDAKRKEVKEVKEQMKADDSKSDKEVEQAIKEVEAKHEQEKIAALREMYQARLSGEKQDNIKAE